MRRRFLGRFPAAGTVLKDLTSPLDLFDVLLALPVVEWARSRQGPAAILPALRARGARRPWRDETGRNRIRRIIARVDRLFPSGPNCYRRALLEIAVDPEAAKEPLHLGLDRGGQPRSGHAWLGDRSDGKRYDAELIV